MLVSIIIPVFNRSESIRETLDSVLSQTYENWECILVDDGSDDDSIDIITSYTTRDSRFKIFSRPNQLKKGANSCRNYGFEKSSGQFIKWLDSDDLLHANLLFSEVQEFLNSKDLECVISGWQGFDESNNFYPIHNHCFDNKVSNGTEVLNSIGKTGICLFPGVYTIRREIIVNSGLWDSNLNINQDGEFYLRVLLEIKHLKAINLVGQYYRYDTANQISKSNRHNDELVSTWKNMEKLALRKDVNVSSYFSYGRRAVYLKFLSQKRIDYILKYFRFFYKEIDYWVLIKVIVYRFIKPLFPKF